LRKIGAAAGAAAVAAGSARALLGAGESNVSAAGPEGPGAAKSTRSNIVMILVDDLGYGDLSSYGAKDLRTPNIDALVAGGMSFSRFYASCPVCSPTRAALLTGRYPALVGVPGVIRTRDSSSWGHLSPSARTLGELIKPAGYDTALVGKWHLGLESPNLPNDRGFDLFEGFLGDMMESYTSHRRDGKNFMRRNGETIDPKGHATDLFTQWACEYIRGRKPAGPGVRPFFLYLPYNAPHFPVQPPKEYLDKVLSRQGGIDKTRALLVALIEHLDDAVGKVVAAIKDAGLADNTLVIFNSDNGGDLGCKADNGPLRDGKGSLYEGGLRVPACAVWPGRIKPGSKTDRVALTMDLMPTILEAAGAKAPDGIEGRSILPTLLGKSQAPETRYLFFTRREGGAYKGKTSEAVLHDDWKLLRNLPDAPLELYNLRDDPQEKTDLAAANPRPKQYDQLKAELDKYVQAAEAVEWRRPSQRKP
jgi:arylsulfatase A-like enzyme